MGNKQNFIIMVWKNKLILNILGGYELCCQKVKIYIAGVYFVAEKKRKITIKDMEKDLNCIKMEVKSRGEVSRNFIQNMYI